MTKRIAIAISTDRKKVAWIQQRTSSRQNLTKVTGATVINADPYHVIDARNALLTDETDQITLYTARIVDLKSDRYSDRNLDIFVAELVNKKPKDWRNITFTQWADQTPDLFFEAFFDMQALAHSNTNTNGVIPTDTKVSMTDHSSRDVSTADEMDQRIDKMFGYTEYEYTPEGLEIIEDFTKATDLTRDDNPQQASTLRTYVLFNEDNKDLPTTASGRICAATECGYASTIVSADGHTYCCQHAPLDTLPVHAMRSRGAVTIRSGDKTITIAIIENEYSNYTYSFPMLLPQTCTNTHHNSIETIDIEDVKEWTPTNSEGQTPNDIIELIKTVPAIAEALGSPKTLDAKDNNQAKPIVL